VLSGSCRIIQRKVIRYEMVDRMKKTSCRWDRQRIEMEDKAQGKNVKRI
jgi:hypothetical protein